MKAPDKIYIIPNAHDGWFEGNKPNDNFVEYIRRDALLEWFKECKENPVITDLQKGNIQEIIEKIESL